MSDTQTIIVEAFERRAEITPRNVETLVRDAVQDTIERLDRGEISGCSLYAFTGVLTVFY